ncbi:hypothetical protein CGH22_15045 [Vibrio parahaemolyticus]|uniref:hypothetical protein n=1 Tax=Vibrio parahaemolyticus TaxID=670 RepID=UPI001121FBC8|nr:hypothetical protein [Vibrio parahaemolyticus]MBE3850025.1 hypothetical protein [Vibrio parahaemolyticus]TOH10709.1 hypothetical protein CGI90_19350 [Vibrio parahaemolyticus]TOP17603.1 hypothetical protein CGH22_15045 [Vibrio parahaemolyticus]TOQ54295.1 hypothetical protein CGG94_02115 [Vibrio parahaemolyticus]HCE2440460.1 hypothetical protein [Vibrio parahaemolyticus]
MAMTIEATKAELIKELEARGFVTAGAFAQNGPFMEAIAAALQTIVIRDMEVKVTSGSSKGTYKVT